MKYYWIIGRVDKEAIRRIGANHIYSTWFKFFFGMSTQGDSFDREGYIFMAEDEFSLFCKITTGYEPVEITERQYNRMVRGEVVKFKEDIRDKISSAFFSQRVSA